MSRKNYHKRVGLDSLKHKKDITRLESIILRLGYSSNDYRINHYGSSVEMIITNQSLHRDLKTIRRTTYGA